MTVTNEVILTSLEVSFKIHLCIEMIVNKTKDVIFTFWSTLQQTGSQL